MDTKAPAFGTIAPLAATEANATLTPVTLPTVSATDLVDGASNQVPSAVRVSCDAPADGKYPVGNTTVVCTATDSRDNANTATIIVTVSECTLCSAAAYEGVAAAAQRALHPAGALCALLVC